MKPFARSGATLSGRAILWIGLLGGLAAALVWISTRPPEPPAPSGGIDLVGAGATFPYPLYRRWITEYAEESGVRINYFSLGSGEGIRLVLEGSVDFGASDRPLRPGERARATCGPFEVPMVVGAVAVAYNVPGLLTPLRLDADVLAAIFLGRITRWDDPALAALNPGRALPSIALHAVHRAPSSGTREIFSVYLDGSRAWRERPAGTNQWPVGISAEGNEGVTSQLQVSPGSIGFVELSYASLARIPVAALRNAAGAFVLPDDFSLAAAATELLTPATVDSITSLVGARDPAAYPVAAVTRLVADRVLRDEVRGRHFVAFVRWALTEGSASASALGYVPLPTTVARLESDRLDRLSPGTCPAANE